jgi:hypothetical protein
VKRNSQKYIFLATLVFSLRVVKYYFLAGTTDRHSTRQVEAVTRQSSAGRFTRASEE